VQPILGTPPIAQGHYTVDLDHSKVGFAVRHMAVATFRGEFSRYGVAVVSDASGVTVSGTVEVASIAVKNPDLEAHLLSPEFFDAERHPQLRFAGSTLRRTGDRIEIDGDLTIRGATQPVTVTGRVADPTEDAFGAVRLGLELEAIIDRTAFGLNWNAPLPKGGLALANDVRLLADLSLVRAG
jgi:polyisoprenoid-binding protein YceI